MSILISAAHASGLKSTSGTDLAPADTVPSEGLDQTSEHSTKKHPPGILNEFDISSLREVARHLSTERTWLKDGMRERLNEMSLRLDELFSEAPRTFELDARLYEIKIDQVRSSSNPDHDSITVFLSHDLYSVYGDDLVLGFVDGKEMLLTEKEISERASYALTASEIDDQLMHLHRSEATPMTGAFDLGYFRPDADRPRLANSDELAKLIAGGPISRSACTHQSTVQSCSGGMPVCSGGQKPYFVLNTIRIFEDNEGFLKGNPEIELFPLNSDGVGQLPQQGSTTTMIFDGRSVVDGAGRARFLPDINNEYTYYSISGGFALLPYQLGQNWVMSLVEQDDTVGVLKSDETMRNVMNFNTPSSTFMVTIDLYDLDFLKIIGQIIKGLIFGGDGDDIFRDPIGVDQTLACGSGLGGSSLVLTTNEWEARGSYSCINPACAPLDIRINGRTDFLEYINGSWSANIVTGTAPFTYTWKKNGVTVGSGSSYSTTSFTSFTLSLTVTDSTGQSDTASVWVNVQPAMCGDVPC